MKGAKVQKVHTFATELAKHSVNQKETTVIGGRGQMPPLPYPWICHCTTA